MKTISQYSILLIDPSFDSEDFIQANIIRNRLCCLPLKIYGIDTILEPGESRTPNATVCAGDDHEKLAVKVFDCESSKWSDDTSIISISHTSIVLSSYEPHTVYIAGKPVARSGIKLIHNLLGTLRDIPPFIFITDSGTPQRAANDFCGEPVDTLLSSLGRSRARFKFHNRDDDPDLLIDEIYRLLRESDPFTEFVHFFNGAPVSSVHDAEQIWVRIRRSADSDYHSFQKLYNDIMGGKARPAGALFRRSDKGDIELYTPSIRPARNNITQTKHIDISSNGISGRTWISNKTGRIAFRQFKCNAPASEDGLSGFASESAGSFSLYNDILSGAFPLCPSSSDVRISMDSIRSLLTQTRIPLGELSARLRSHILKHPDCADAAGETLADLTARNKSIFLPMAEKKLADMAYERTSCKIAFTVCDANATAQPDNSHRITIQAVLPSPIGVTPALCYIDNILDALRLLEAPRPLSGNSMETHYFYGLKIAPRLETYEISLDFKPRTPDIPQEETDRFIQNTLFMLYEFMQSLIVTDLRKDISIFDLIGPSMIGPSSSHTCGANRIGRLARRVINMMVPDSFDPEKNIICLSARLHNSFRKAGEGHRTHNALAAGLLHDMPQDYDGNGNDKIAPWLRTPADGRPENIAFFDFKPWQHDGKTMTCPWDLPGEKGFDAHWAGYHKFDPSKNGNDAPLPETHPNDIHENSVAIIVKAIPREKSDGQSIKDVLLLNPADREFNWDDFDLVLIGESIGGGKIRIRSIGGNWLSGRTDYFVSRGWASPSERLCIFPRDASIPPLDGNHESEYPGVPNLNPIYPPKGQPAEKDAALPYHDLDSMIEHSQQTGHDFFRLALEYEAWCLGLKYSDEIAELIMLEARKMLKSLDQSSRPFGDIDFDSNTPETSNVIKTYMNLREAFNNESAEFLGNSFYDAVSGAITAMTRNAFSELILAAPTGGACGILPGVFLALKNMKVKTGEISAEDFEEKTARALLVCGFFAALTANIVPPSGAEKGCQAETGTAAGMGAAFATYFLDGSREQVVNAMILSIKNSLGLVCDPIAGKVNTPCIKRNAFKAIEALLGAWLSLNGIVSFVSPNQVIKAMAQIGDDMADRYRETSEGGLAKTIDGLKERMCKFG